MPISSSPRNEWFYRKTGGLSTELTATMKGLYLEIAKSAFPDQVIDPEKVSSYIKTRKEAHLPYREVPEGYYNEFQYTLCAEHASNKYPRRHIYAYATLDIHESLLAVVSFSAHNKIDPSFVAKDLIIQDVTNPANVDAIIDYWASNWEEATSTL